MFPVEGWPISNHELLFAQSLLKDLGPLGFDVSLQGDLVQFNQVAPKSAAKCREFYDEAHRRLHKKSLAEKWPSIIDFESAYGKSAFIEGRHLNLAAIDPRLRSVDLRRKAKPAQRDSAIVGYLRAYQTVASRRSVGRENVYILEDHGHPNVPVMGVLVLASPRYYQPQRDEVLGWPTPTDVSLMSARRQKRLSRIRLAGLSRMMQVAICCALPPYSQLGAASLLAVAPFVHSVHVDFQQRWYDRQHNRDPDLIAATTTTSMGLTGTPFQALYTAMFFDSQSSQTKGEKWNTENTVYARLSRQHPWLPNVSLRTLDPRARFLSLVSSQTWNLALAVAGPAIAPKRREWLLHIMSPQVRNRILKHALDRIGATTRIFLGNPVGVFLGAVDRPALESLREGTPRQARPVLSWDKAVARFRSEYDTAQAERCGNEARTRAVAARVQRALQTTLDNILLSNHLT